MEKIDLAINNQKKLPSNLEAEQALIGSILVNNEILDEVSNLINSDKFFDPGHKKIFKIIESLNSRGMIANPITIKNFIDNDKENSLADVGGTEYLIKLTRFSSSTKQSIDYAKIIHENFVKRELINIAEKINLDAFDDSLDSSSEEIIESSEKLLFDLAERGSFSQSFLKFNSPFKDLI